MYASYVTCNQHACRYDWSLQGLAPAAPPADRPTRSGQDTLLYHGKDGVYEKPNGGIVTEKEGAANMAHSEGGGKETPWGSAPDLFTKAMTLVQMCICTSKQDSGSWRHRSDLTAIKGFLRYTRDACRSVDFCGCYCLEQGHIDHRIDRSVRLLSALGVRCCGAFDVVSPFSNRPYTSL